MTRLSAIWLAVAGLLASGGVWAERPPEGANAKPASAPPDRIVAELHRMLANVRLTEYAHTTRVDEVKGEYVFDCSGLACYVLRRQLPEHYRNIPMAKKRPRPLAVDFYQCFAAAPTGEAGRDGWRRIARLSDARPGDIIAWRSAAPRAGGSTGHVVIVDDQPVIAANGEIRVAVIDSTSSRHGSDTRKPGQTGLGRGTMWFAVDGEGKPTGCRWGSPKHQLRTRDIAIGRAVPIENKK